jgi:hypothetical protein
MAGITTLAMRRLAVAWRATGAGQGSFARVPENPRNPGIPDWCASPKLKAYLNAICRFIRRKNSQQDDVARPGQLAPQPPVL